MSRTPPQTPERSPRTPRRISSTPRRRRRPSSSRSRASTPRRRRSLGNISPPSPPRFNNRLTFDDSDTVDTLPPPPEYGLPQKRDPATYASGLSIYSAPEDVGHFAMPRGPGAFLAQAETPQIQEQMRERTLLERALPFDDEVAVAWPDTEIPQVAEAVPYDGPPPPSKFMAEVRGFDDEDLNNATYADAYWLDPEKPVTTAEAWIAFGKMVKRGCKILKSHHKKGKESKKSLIKQLKSQKMPKNRFGLRKFYIKYVESL